MLDVIGYYVNQLAMLDIGSLAGSDHYSQPYNDPFLPHEEELYNKLVHHLASSSSSSGGIWADQSNVYVPLTSDWLE